MSTKTKTQSQVQTASLRATLKDLMQKELQKLPESLAALEPKERLDVLCKLMPYVFPKVDTVHISAGEKSDFSW